MATTGKAKRRCPKGVCKNTPEKKANAILKEMQRCIDTGKPMSRKSLAFIRSVPKILGVSVERK